MMLLFPLMLPVYLFVLALDVSAFFLIVALLAGRYSAELLHALDSIGEDLVTILLSYPRRVSSEWWDRCSTHKQLILCLVCVLIIRTLGVLLLSVVPSVLVQSIPS